MIITLKLYNGEMLDFAVDGNQAVVGRSPSCEIVVKHEGLSRQHCLIEKIDGDFFITDLDSTNGVLLDGQRIIPSQRTLLQTYLPVSFGPVESLQTHNDLTVSRILQSSRTKFFKNEELGLRKEKKPARLSRPVVNPVKLPKPPRRNTGNLLFNVLLITAILGVAVWFTVNKQKNQDNKTQKVEKLQTRESDYF